MRKKGRYPEINIYQNNNPWISTSQRVRNGSNRSNFLKEKFGYRLTDEEAARIGTNEVSLNVIDEIAKGLYEFLINDVKLHGYYAESMKNNFINGTVIGFRISATLTAEYLTVWADLFRVLKTEDLIKLRKKFKSYKKSNAIDFIIFRKALDIEIKKRQSGNQKIG